jgi:hypothetical protein
MIIGEGTMGKVEYGTRKLRTYLIVFVLVFSMMVVVDLSIEVNQNVSGATIYVDDDGGADYENIQDAINESNDGDTIFVYSGGYGGPVEIYGKQNLSIIGENMRTTTITGGTNPHLNPGEPYYPGVDIQSSRYVVLKNFNIQAESFPVILSNSDNITLDYTIIGGSLCYATKVDCISSSNIVIKNSRFWEEGSTADFWAHFDSDDVIIENCVFEYWKYGDPHQMEYRGAYFWINDDSHILAVNCVTGLQNPADTSTFSIGWYLTVNVFNIKGDPIEGATVQTRNVFGTIINTSTTDNNGILSNIIVKEIVQNSTSSVSHTPHNITASKHSLKGFADPQPFMDDNKNITIILHEQGDSIFLPYGSNLISTNLIQSNTSLQSVLKPIAGKYRAVQWYDGYDNADPWKNHLTIKPSHMNDLNDLDHTMGFWVDIIDPEGTTFIFNGTEPISNQNIQLYKGWNMVGYPSLTNQNRTNGLNNLEFGKVVDAIQWLDSSTKTWYDLGVDDSFEIGRGYWIHARTDCVWEVPL